MTELIGASLRVLGTSKWSRFDDDQLFSQFPVLEINRKFNGIRMRTDHVEKKKHLIKNHRFALHSASSFGFAGEHVFNKTARYTLLSEIELASMMGIERIIFHIIEPYSTETAEFIANAKSIADDKKVMLAFENNAIPWYSGAEEILKIIDQTGVKANLDIGHLKASGKTMDNALDIIDQLKNHIVHAHIHSNKGDKDTHDALRMDDEFAVSMVTQLKNKVNNELWWVIEVLNYDDVAPTYETLKKLLQH